MADVIREARDSAVKSRRFLDDTVKVSTKLLAEKNTASMTQEKRESFMARLRCPEQATASGEESVTDRDLLPVATWLWCVPSDYWDIPYYRVRCPLRSFALVKGACWC